MCFSQWSFSCEGAKEGMAVGSVRELRACVCVLHAVMGGVHVSVEDGGVAPRGTPRRTHMGAHRVYTDKSISG